MTLQNVKLYSEIYLQAKFALFNMLMTSTCSKLLSINTQFLQIQYVEMLEKKSKSKEPE